MSDQFERQLREHLAREAAQVRYLSRPLASRIETTVESRRRPATLQQLALVAGLVIVAALLAVALSQARSFRSEPAGVAGHWEENLTFSGAIAGTVHSTVADVGGDRSSCTGRFSAAAGSWSSNFVVQLAGKLYNLDIGVDSYSGPGRYPLSPSSRPRPKVVISDLEHSIAWGALGADATFSVDPGQESGTLEATLSRVLESSGPLPSDLDDKLHVSGRWTCRTRL